MQTLNTAFKQDRSILNTTDSIVSYFISGVQGGNAIQPTLVSLRENQEVAGLTIHAYIPARGATIQFSAAKTIPDTTIYSIMRYFFQSRFNYHQTSNMTDIVSFSLNIVLYNTDNASKAGDLSRTTSRFSKLGLSAVSKPSQKACIE